MDDLVLSLPAFVKKLAGTRDLVWARVLNVYHGSEKHTEKQWRAILETLRKKPA